MARSRELARVQPERTVDQQYVDVLRMALGDLLDAYYRGVHISDWDGVAVDAAKAAFARKPPNA